MIPLDDSGPGRFNRLFSKGHRAAVRQIRRQGDMKTRTGGLELLDEFLPLLDDTYRRLEARPTHSIAELTDLLGRMPDRVEIWIAIRDDNTIAATLLFHLNSQVCTAFYICDRFETRHHHGSSFLFATLIDDLGERGFRYLDLGPSATTDHFNAGVVSFKEHLGAESFCRDEYRWLR